MNPAQVCTEQDLD